MNRLTFRPEVEGLRALAVVAVMLYHSGFRQQFSGGFVGVDVFFVISGFLITSNILSEVTAGRFSFGRFYERRIRRLFPALLVTVAATMAVGVLTSSPFELVTIAQSAIASIFSASNFHFWSQVGYFDSSAIQKPLLHTWSLAVEEQFYVVWPAVVTLLAWRVRNRQYGVAALVGLVIVSTWAAERALVRSPSDAFYLAPYRVGEFALGACCAWIPAWRRWPRAVSEAMVALGLGFMLVPVFRYSDATAFPGLSALVPCTGAALVILAGSIGTNDSRLASWLLGNRAAVGIGRISYSLYLTHWPIYVFQQQRYGELGTMASLAGGAMALATAVAMHRYVEQPFRLHSGSREPSMSTMGFARLFGGTTTAVVALAVAMWWGQGWWWRIPERLVRLAHESNAERAKRFDLFNERCPPQARVSCDEPAASGNLFVLGDSHGPDAFNALVAEFPHYHYVMLTAPGCPPLARADHGLLVRRSRAEREACIALAAKTLEGTLLSRADVIVINVMYQWYQPPHLRRAIDQIRRQTSAPLYVLGNYLVFLEDVPDMVLKHRRTTMDAVYERRLDWNSFAFEPELEAMSKELGFTYVSKRRLFCRGDAVTDCPLMIGDKLFTYDRHHLSVAAARALGAALKRDYGRDLSALSHAQAGRQPTGNGAAAVATTGSALADPITR